MPNKSIISEGNTTNEAIEKGLKILNVSKNMVDIKVLETEKKSFFSILAPRVVKVELTLKGDVQNISNKKEEVKKEVIKKERMKVSQEALDTAESFVKNFLDEFFKKIGENISYEIKKDEYGLEILVTGKDAALLIGYRGETLYAAQKIISAVANKKCKEPVRVSLDIENYKEKREKTLCDLAQKVAKIVEKTRKPVKLEPMGAYERKIIHSYLQSNEKVKTESIGQEPRRRVVISLK